MLEQQQGVGDAACLPRVRTRSCSTYASRYSITPSWQIHNSGIRSILADALIPAAERADNRCMAAIEATDLHEGPTAPVWRLLGDEALARAAGRGNDHAFAALYARYSQPLRGYCASILLNSEDAEDAVQATMLKAMRALPARRPGLPIRPWLYRIAHNEAVDTLRRRRFHRDVEEEISPALLAPGPDADLASRERLAELVLDLRTLPDRQRAALLMRELSGLGYDEIAGALEVTPGAVRQLVFEARTTLHEFKRGRESACATVQRTLSDADRRRHRARSVRAHLRSCNACRALT